MHIFEVSNIMVSIDSTTMKTKKVRKLAGNAIHEKQCLAIVVQGNGGASWVFADEAKSSVIPSLNYKFG